MADSNNPHRWVVIGDTEYSYAQYGVIVHLIPLMAISNAVRWKAEIVNTPGAFATLHPLGLPHTIGEVVRAAFEHLAKEQKNNAW